MNASYFTSTSMPAECELNQNGMKRERLPARLDVNERIMHSRRFVRVAESQKSFGRVLYESGRGSTRVQLSSTLILI